MNRDTIHCTYMTSFISAVEYKHIYVSYVLIINTKYHWDAFLMYT